MTRVRKTWAACSNRGVRFSAVRAVMLSAPLVTLVFPEDAQPRVRARPQRIGEDGVALGRQVGGVQDVEVAPDGKSVASVGMDGNTVIWAAKPGRELRRLAAVPAGPTRVLSTVVL